MGRGSIRTSAASSNDSRATSPSQTSGTDLTIRSPIDTVASMDPLVDYELELTGTFVFEIRATVRGRPGLERAAINALIEEGWEWISDMTGPLLESEWELESFRELAPAELEPPFAWVVLVTRGFTVDQPPELYTSESSARCEAARWARTIAARESVSVEVPFEGRWQVGEWDVRLVRVTGPLGPEPWIGTYWTHDGHPDPEALLLENREDARTWVVSPVRGTPPTQVREREDFIAATFFDGDREEYAVAHRAKTLA